MSGLLAREKLYDHCLDRVDPGHQDSARAAHDHDGVGVGGGHLQRGRVIQNDTCKEEDGSGMNKRTCVTSAFCASPRLKLYRSKPSVDVTATLTMTTSDIFATLTEAAICKHKRSLSEEAHVEASMPSL